jgi:hypothetical protein
MVLTPAIIAHPSILLSQVAYPAISCPLVLSLFVGSATSQYGVTAVDIVRYLLFYCIL